MATSMRRQTELPAKVEDLARRVIGCAIEVHRRLGPGLLEKVYERALEIELRRAGISARTQVTVPVYYRDEKIGEHVLDMDAEGLIVLELKSAEAVSVVHRATVISYLRVADRPLGLIMNFNTAVLKDGIERFVNLDWSGLSSSLPSSLRDFVQNETT
ncbi:MAG: GxxExxY protein [Phycisphaerales bacterium]